MKAEAKPRKKKEQPDPYADAVGARLEPGCRVFRERRWMKPPFGTVQSVSAAQRPYRCRVLWDADPKNGLDAYTSDPRTEQVVRLPPDFKEKL